MFKKMKLQKQIKDLQKQIEEVEHKRNRSQSVLVEAILTNTTPDDADVDYFNKYTSEIDALRIKMKEIQAQLDALEA